MGLNNQQFLHLYKVNVRTFTKSSEVDGVRFLTHDTKKLRHREGKSLAQCHTAMGWSMLDLNPGLLALRNAQIAPSYTPSPLSHHLPHDPGDQHHGGVVEGVEEADEQLPLRPQLPQAHAKGDGKHHQAQDIHTLHLTLHL